MSNDTDGDDDIEALFIEMLSVMFKLHAMQQSVDPYLSSLIERAREGAATFENENEIRLQLEWA